MKDVKAALEVRALMAKHGTSALVAATKGGLRLPRAEPAEPNPPAPRSARRAECMSDAAFQVSVALAEARARWRWD